MRLALVSCALVSAACGGVVATSSDETEPDAAVGTPGGGGVGGTGGYAGAGGVGAVAGVGAVGGFGGLAGTSGVAGFDGSVPSCSDQLKNGDETDVDCGGGCPTCGTGQSCEQSADCLTGVCSFGKCFDATVYAIQSSLDSVACAQTGNVVVKAGLSFAPVVVASQHYSVNASYFGYYVHDPLESWPPGSTGEYRGALLLVPKVFSMLLAPGDLTQVVGDHAEFHCMTEIVAASVTKTGSAQVAAPLAVDPNVFAAGGSAKTEPYEGNLVTLTNVVVTDATGGTQPNWWFQVTGGALVTNDFALGFTPQVGTPLKTLTGGVRLGFGKYMVAPRWSADLDPG